MASAVVDYFDRARLDFLRDLIAAPLPRSMPTATNILLTLCNPLSGGPLAATHRFLRHTLGNRAGSNLFPQQSLACSTSQCPSRLCLLPGARPGHISSLLHRFYGPSASSHHQRLFSQPTFFDVTTPSTNPNYPFSPLSQIHQCLHAFHFPSTAPQQEFVPAVHYCSHAGQRGDLHQCVVYDSTEKNARLIGIEYIITEETFHSECLALRSSLACRTLSTRDEEQNYREKKRSTGILMRTKSHRVSWSRSA